MRRGGQADAQAQKPQDSAPRGPSGQRQAAVEPARQPTPSPAAAAVAAAAATAPPADSLEALAICGRDDGHGAAADGRGARSKAAAAAQSSTMPLILNYAAQDSRREQQRVSQPQISDEVDYDQWAQQAEGEYLRKKAARLEAPGGELPFPDSQPYGSSARQAAGEAALAGGGAAEEDVARRAREQAEKAAERERLHQQKEQERQVRRLCCKNHNLVL